VESPRPAATGDICVLLAPSRPLSGSGAALIDRLQAAFGGERVEPIHVTVDRVPGDDAAALVRIVHKSLTRLRHAPVLVDRLFFLPSQSRGPEIVKLEVAPHAVLDADVDVLLAALRDSGLPSLYSSDRAKSTITALQRVTRGPSVTTEMSDVPVELFVADQVIVSRIVGLARYEVLDTASIPTSG